MRKAAPRLRRSLLLLWSLFACTVTYAGALRVDDSDEAEGSWYGREWEASQKPVVAYGADEIKLQGSRSKIRQQITRGAPSGRFRASQDQVRALRAFGKDYIGEWEHAGEELHGMRQILLARKKAIEDGLKKDEAEDEYCVQTEEELKSKLQSQKQDVEDHLEAYQKAAYHLRSDQELKTPGLTTQMFTTLQDHRQEMQKVEMEIQQTMDEALRALSGKEPLVSSRGYEAPSGLTGYSDKAPPVASSSSSLLEDLEEKDEAFPHSASFSAHLNEELVFPAKKKKKKEEWPVRWSEEQNLTAPDNETVKRGYARWYKPIPGILGPPADVNATENASEDDDASNAISNPSEYDLAVQQLRQSLDALQDSVGAWQNLYERCTKHQRRRTPEYEERRKERQDEVENLAKAIDTLEAYKGGPEGGQWKKKPSSSSAAALDPVLDPASPASASNTPAAEGEDDDPINKVDYAADNEDEAEAAKNFSRVMAEPNVPSLPNASPRGLVHRRRRRSWRDSAPLAHRRRRS